MRLEKRRGQRKRTGRKGLEGEGKKEGGGRGGERDIGRGGRKRAEEGVGMRAAGKRMGKGGPPFPSGERKGTGDRGQERNKKSACEKAETSPFFSREGGGRGRRGERERGQRGAQSLGGAEFLLDYKK